MRLAAIKKFLTKNKKEAIFIFVLLLVTIPLRFINLSYSDYIGDEHKSFAEPKRDQTLVEFFLTRRKGPVQFFISEIPHAITGDYHNELAERIPYAIFSVMSVVMFYALVKKLTKSKEVAFVASLLFTLNGFIIGFGRIAQYQNLNLFFSLSALYFYADLLYERKDLIRSTLLGTIMFCISFLSHWDAVFAVPPIVLIFSKFLLNKDFSVKFKLTVLLANTVLGCLLLLPFLIPFVQTQKGTPANLRYMSRRLDFGYYNAERYKFLIDLYNPFFTYWFLIVAAVLSLLWLRVSWEYWAWFLVSYGIFEIFVRKPGTHIYNFLIPIFVLGGITIVNLIKIAPRFLKKGLYVVVFLMMLFFFYQAHMIFVDHNREYPWENEVLFTFVCPEMEDRLRRLTKCGEFVINHFETKDYKIEDKPPLFGFPLYRRWDEINDIVVSDMKKVGAVGYGFMTNEDKTVCQWYMEPDYRADGGVYIVGVKRPLSFREDWQFTHIGGKNLIAELYNDERLVVKIWRVDPK
jgi:hypothetical protein